MHAQQTLQAKSIRTKF